MFKPICLLLTGLLTAANLFGQTETAKKPDPATAGNAPATDATKATTLPSPPPVVTSPAAAPANAAPQTAKNPPPLDPANMDTSVKPQDDFYLYANGTWIKNNPVPPEFSRWAAFTELGEKNNAALHEIAEKAMTAAASSDGMPAPL